MTSPASDAHREASEATRGFNGCGLAGETEQ